LKNVSTIWLKLGLACASLSALASAAAFATQAEVHDATFEAYRSCLTALDGPEHQAGDNLGVTIIGATRTGTDSKNKKVSKPGVYSLTPGGVTYFHECAAELRPSALAFPRKINPKQQDYSLPPGKSINVAAAGAATDKPVDRWYVDKTNTPTATSPVCVGYRVSDPVTEGVIRKQIEASVKSKRYGATEAESARAVAEAIKQLTRRHPKPKNDDGKAHFSVFKPQEYLPEAATLLENRVLPLVTCRNALLAVKPYPSKADTDLAAELMKLIGPINVAIANTRNARALSVPEPSGRGAGGAGISTPAGP
jgi:hypothetical protein